MPETFDPYRIWFGIARKDQPPHAYRLLGLDLYEAEPDVIVNAADQRMSHLRTLQTSQHAVLSQRLLNEISTAKLTLLDEAKKAAYDDELRARLDAGSPPEPPPPREVVPPRPAKRPARPSAERSAPTPIVKGASAKESVQSSTASAQARSKLPAIGLGIGAAVLILGAVIFVATRTGETPGPIGSSDGEETPGATDRDVPGGPGTGDSQFDVTRPRLATIDSQEIDEGAELSLMLIDSQGTGRHDYRVTLAERPRGARFQAREGAFVWTPQEADGPGEHRVVVQVIAKATGDVIAETAFTITVNEVNQPPELSDIPEFEVAPKQTLKIQFAAIDPDGENTSIRFSLPDRPEGATVDAATGQFMWSPTDDQAGREHSVTVRVDEADDGSAENTLHATKTFAIRCVRQPQDTGGRGLLVEVFKSPDWTKRLDRRIDTHLEWLPPEGASTGKPAPLALRSARWTGWLRPPMDGEFQIMAVGTGRLRLWIDDLETPLLDADLAATGHQASASRTLAARAVPVRVEFTPKKPTDWMQVRWIMPDGSESLVSATSLFHQEKAAADAIGTEPGDVTDTSGLQGDYFTGSDFSKKHATRVDPCVDAAWPTGAPDLLPKPAPFAVRWTGTLRPTHPGRYRMALVHDGVARLWIDDQLVMDHTANAGPGRSEEETELSEHQTVRIEYLHKAGPAICSLRWTPPGNGLEVVVPVTRFSFDAARLLGKLAVPDAEAVADAQALVRKAYGSKLRDRDPASRAEVTRQLIDESEQEEPAAQYAMLAEALDRATSSGNLALAWVVLRQLDARFLLDDLVDRQIRAIKASGRGSGTPMSHYLRAYFYLSLIREMRQAGEFDQALALVGTATSAAAKSAHSEMRAELNHASRDLRALVKLKERAESARKALDEDPENAEAALAVGRWQCLMEEDWPRGLATLEHSSEEAHREVARLEQSKDSTPANGRAIADKWRALAEKEREGSSYHLAMLRRALEWLEQIEPNARGGLEKKEVAHQIATLRQALLPAGVASPQDVTPATPKFVRTLVNAVLSAKAGRVRLANGTLYQRKNRDKLPKGDVDVREIRLHDNNVDDAVLEQLSHVMSLQALDLSSSKITNTGVGYLCSLPNLKSLSVNAPLFTDDGFSLFLGTELTSLNVTSDQITGGTLDRLQRLRSLRSLGVGGPSICGATFFAVAHCDQLTSFGVRDGQYEPKSITMLKQLPALRRFNVRNTNATDTALKEIARVSQLNHVGVTAPITSRGIGYLTSLKLSSIAITSPQFADGQLKVFQKFLGLRGLTLRIQQVSNAGLANLVAIKTLLHLDVLSARGVTSAGLANAQTLPNLRFLRLLGATYDLQAYQRFVKARPKCRLLPVRKPPKP